MSALKKFKAICTGWKNVIWASPQIKKMAMKRAKECAKCDHIIAIMGKGICCGKCFCPITAKTKVPGERCPIGTWEAEPKEETTKT